MPYPAAYQIGQGRKTIGLQPGLVRAEYPTRETPQRVPTFINRFMTAKGDFPSSEFRVIGWIHSSEKQWWFRMVNFALVQLEDLLWQAGLYGAVRAILHGIPQSNHHFYAVLERYNPETCMFFTPVGEMGFALHEMYEVSGW